MVQSETETGVSLVTTCEGFISSFESVVAKDDPSNIDVAVVHSAYLFLNSPDLRDGKFWLGLSDGERIALASALSDLAWVAGIKPGLLEAFGCEDAMEYARENLLLTRELSRATGDALRLVKTTNNIAVLDIRQARGVAGEASLDRIREAETLLKDIVDDYGLEVALATETSTDFLVKLVEVHNNLAQASIVRMELQGNYDKGTLIEAIDRARAARNLIEGYIPTTTDKDLIGAHILLTNSIAHLMILDGSYEEAGLMLVNSYNLQGAFGIQRFDNETFILAGLNMITQVEREEDTNSARALLESTIASIGRVLERVGKADEEDLRLLEGLKAKIANQTERLGVRSITDSATPPQP